MIFKTREAWLEAAIKEISPLFVNAGYVVPACRVSCGFASNGVRGGHIRQCWSTKASSDKIIKYLYHQLLRSIHWSMSSFTQ
jgi:hypothetical protein